MQITNSLMGAGLSAFQNGQQRVEQAASSIASPVRPRWAIPRRSPSSPKS